MRFSFAKCTIVFIIGWIGGLILIQYVFESPKSKSLRSSFATYREDGSSDPNSSEGGVVRLFNSVGKVISDYSMMKSATPAPTPLRKQRFLPRFLPHNSSGYGGGKGDSIYIFLDWPVDDKLFTVDNYKALESMLTVYPTATFRCLLATSRDAFAHKIGNALSITQFEKYKKRRYNINVVPLNTKLKSRTTSLGENYREKWYTACCSHCNASCRATDHTQPYHLRNYIRLTHLWQNGGIFSDFSFFFLGPITAAEVMQGFSITSWCSHQYQIENWLQDPSLDTTSRENRFEKHVKNTRRKDKNGSNQPQGCVTSTLLAFNAPRHEAILCVLARYDDSDFLDCIDSDVQYTGATCVRAAFEKCFATLNLENGFATTRSRESAATGVVLSSSTDNSVAETIADADADAHTVAGADANADVAGVLLRGARGKNEVLSQDPVDIDTTRRDASLARRNLQRSAAEQVVLEMFQFNAFRASNTLLSQDWSLEPERRVFWLGSLAWTGSWKNYPYRNGTLLAAAVKHISLKKAYFNDLTTSAQCKLDSRPTRCHHYSKNLSVLVQSASKLVGASGAGAGAGLGELGNVKRSSLFGRFSPVSALGSYNTGIEEISCSPTVTIAGFQKSASTFLFDALTRHPSVLPALTGSQHKETHCYSQDPRHASKLLQRSWCYPFIEESDSFVSVDGTVSYDIDQDVPITIRQDNPDMKVIFVVRNPVERLYSSFKFSYSTFSKFGNFDEFILPGMDLYQKFGELRQMLTNGTDLTTLIGFYYNTTYNGDSPARGPLFMHSLYAFPIAHYQRVLGKENVKVVSAEDLDVHDPVRLYDTLNEVFSFIGVCPIPISDLIPSLPSRNVLPFSNQLSQDVYHRLQKFFRPFNNLMATLGGVNVTAWNDKLPPSKLPKYSPFNKTLPQLWFEIREDKKSHFLPQLLPQRRKFRI